MAPTTTAHAADIISPASRVFDLPEMWAKFAELGRWDLVEASRMMVVCRASRVAVLEWLATLPGLVLCGGAGARLIKDDVFKLDLKDKTWRRVGQLLFGARDQHACCAVRGTAVVLCGRVDGGIPPSCTETVEMLVEYLDSEQKDEILAFEHPAAACGPLNIPTAVSVDEDESEDGQVLLIGGADEDDNASAVHKVDLATGACTPLASLSQPRMGCTAARLPDGRVVCVEGWDPESQISAELFEPPLEQGGVSEAAWQWRLLPAMSVERFGAGGCVLSDGRFAVFGGMDRHGTSTAECEALTLDGEERWEPLPPMLEARTGCACVAVGGCVIVAGGERLKTAEVYQEAFGRWRRLPCTLPHSLAWMGAALL